MRSAHKKSRIVIWTITLLAVLISMAASASSVLNLNLSFDLTRGKHGLQLRVHEPDELGTREKRSGEKKSVRADSFDEDSPNDSNKDSGAKDDDDPPSKHVLRSKSEESSAEDDENRGVTHALDAREYEPKEPERTRDKDEDEDNNNSNESNGSD